MFLKVLMYLQYISSTECGKFKQNKRGTDITGQQLLRAVFVSIYRCYRWLKPSFLTSILVHTSIFENGLLVPKYENITA